MERMSFGLFHCVARKPDTEAASEEPNSRPKRRIRVSEGISATSISRELSLWVRLYTNREVIIESVPT
jgi:hypothetical protein